MAETREIRVGQFHPGCKDGDVLFRGIIQRVIHSRTIEIGDVGLYNRPILWHTYYYVEYNCGNEYEVNYRPNSYSPGYWELLIHGDDIWIPDPVCSSTKNPICV